MRIRNKKTGRVFDVIVREKRNGNGEYSIIVCNLRAIRSARSVNCILGEYDFLAKLYEDWEDYKPTEPLIKDEEIRKAVIAWVKANSQRTRVAYKQLDETISCLSFIDFGGLVIEFNKPIDGLTDGKIYKFTELCGEE